MDRAEAALDEETRTLDVIVRVPSPLRSGALEDGSQDAAAGADSGPPLLVGKFVEVELEGLAPETYFMVRRPALRPGNEVWVVRDEELAIVPVAVLQKADDDVYVTGAIQPGDAVVVGGIQIATEGMRVRTAAGKAQ